jgi:hypothetical protein
MRCRNRETLQGQSEPHVLNPRQQCFIVRQLQREHDLVPDGIVGPRSWATLAATA